MAALIECRAGAPDKQCAPTSSITSVPLPPRGSHLGSPHLVPQPLQPILQCPEFFEKSENLIKPFPSTPRLGPLQPDFLEWGPLLPSACSGQLC